MKRALSSIENVPEKKTRRSDCTHDSGNVKSCPHIYMMNCLLDLMHVPDVVKRSRKNGEESELCMRANNELAPEPKVSVRLISGLLTCGENIPPRQLSGILRHLKMRMLIYSVRIPWRFYVNDYLIWKASGQF
jgi:hypothetical protein